MAGTVEGGKHAAKTNLERYGKDFYRSIGRRGGISGRGKGYTGGFASTIVGPDGLTGPERARKYGALGGKKSRRTGIKNGEGKAAVKDIEEIEKILEEESND